MTSSSATEGLGECGHVRCYGRRMVIWRPGFTSSRHKQHPGGLQDEDCGLSPGHLSITRNLSRRHPQKTFEPVRQMALVGAANGGRDVRDGDTAKQQLACALDSYVLQVRVRREPDLFLKSPGEIERAEMDERSQFPKRNILNVTGSLIRDRSSAHLRRQVPQLVRIADDVQCANDVSPQSRTLQSVLFPPVCPR